MTPIKSTGRASNHKNYIVFSYLTVASNIATGFVLMPLIANRLGVDALGVFGLLFSLYSIVSIGVGGFCASLVKNLIHYRYLRNRIFVFSVYMNVAYGIFGASVIVLYGYMQKPEYMYSFYCFSIYTMISFFMLPFYNVMIAELRQAEVAFFRFLQQLLFSVLSISGFLFFDAVALYSVFFALFLSVVVVFFVVLIYFIRQFKYTFHFYKIKRAVAHKLLVKDGSQYFLNGISTILLLQIDVLLIDYLYGAKSVGIYLILWKIPNTLIMLGWRLSDPFAGIIANKLREKRQSEIERDFRGLEIRIFGAALFSALCYLFLGPSLIELWMGFENRPNIEYMYGVSALVIVFSVLQRLYLSVNYYTSGLANVTILQFIEISFKCVFIIFFFDYFHELAPVIGWLVAFLFTILFYRKNSLVVIRK